MSFPFFEIDCGNGCRLPIQAKKECEIAGQGTFIFPGREPPTKKFIINSLFVKDRGKNSGYSAIESRDVPATPVTRGARARNGSRNGCAT